MAKLITSPSNPIIKDIKSLEMRKRRKETGQFLVEGLRSVIEGVDLNWVLKYIVYHTDVKDKDDVKRCVEYCEKSGGWAIEANTEVLEKVSRKDNPQLVIGVFEQRVTPLARAKYANAKCFVLLEQVRDPGNLGTIIRTVDAIGADGVILIDKCCDPFSVEAIRATMGSVFAVPIFQASRDEFLEWVKVWRGDIIGTTLQSSVDFREITPKSPILLMMGNEQAGLSDELRQIATNCIRLPMNGRADSLNLAVATGIALYAMMEPWK